MAEFGLIKSFDIDHGELDGQSPQQCFVLGYELAALDCALEAIEEPFSRPVHAENKARIEKSCCDSRRPFALTWMAGDSSESWLDLQVGPKAQKATP